ncbi:hypothetical protein KR51_00024000 [Rubidibacter lacunae KORDI 51-2]|uniref:Uncharacterized protein n=1 Tax=Rubidibacter lacunae KORDI 51-2 TaxID=582515 RepID=U5DHN3_9CHRO|nr:hypothetical protein KR51_00024000 [Rubidibacter lacunae KORDI 51-2]
MEETPIDLAAMQCPSCGHPKSHKHASSTVREIARSLLEVAFRDRNAFAFAQ